jgi:hypothetical protein
LPNAEVDRRDDDAPAGVRRLVQLTPLVEAQPPLDLVPRQRRVVDNIDDVLPEVAERTSRHRVHVRRIIAL